MRDENNNLIGFTYKNETYYYKKNIQEDIIGIYNNKYEQIVEYEYDAWGRILSIKDGNGQEITNPSHIAHINPFRYRSYYYDEETKLYYLNSRYYNPEWGRFISSDRIIGIDNNNIGYNLYTYCKNILVNQVDDEGTSALAIFGGSAAAGAIASGLGAALAVGAFGVIGVALLVAAAKYTQTAVKSKEYGATKEDSKKGNHSVYVLVDEVNNTTQKCPGVEYVGRTTHLDVRAYQHGKNDFRKNLQMYVVIQDVTLEVARGVEQDLIEKCETKKPGVYKNNQINGINPNDILNYDRYKKSITNYFGEEVYVGGIEW